MVNNDSPKPEPKTRLDHLSEGEIKLMAAVLLNMKEGGMPDWDLTATECNSKSGDSCRVRYNAIKRKLNGLFPDHAPAGGITKDSPSKVKAAKPKKAIGAGEGGTPKKPRGRPPKKEVKVEEEEKSEVKEEERTFPDGLNMDSDEENLVDEF